ncbi:MAG: hypothetical protein KKD44_10515 [Proteobacteria bacterium]|nr:hypothetical protein [Pseudomonadota bacterium]
MDKGRQYIQMCKRSKEIQSIWTPKAGDFYANSDNTVLCWIPGAPQSGIIKNGFKIEPGAKITRIDPLVWLPKLDQLIEISQVPGTNFRDITFVFYEWVKRPYAQKKQAANLFFSSLEQLWFAFIMTRKFSKAWTGEGWVNL